MSLKRSAFSALCALLLATILLPFAQESFAYGEEGSSVADACGTQTPSDRPMVVSEEQASDNSNTKKVKTGAVHTVSFSNYVPNATVNDGDQVTDPDYFKTGTWEHNDIWWYGHEYHFAGWVKLDPSTTTSRTTYAEARHYLESASFYDFNTPVTEDTYLGAVFLFDTHRVTMKVKTNMGSTSYDHDNLAGEPMQYAKDWHMGYSSVFFNAEEKFHYNDHTFLGWFDENNKQYNGDTPITRDVTLTARWKSKYQTLAGTTALETMAKIQEDAFAANSCDTVIVATAASYYDALAASGLAGAIKAKSGKDVPVLITDKEALSSETASTIAHLGASHVIIAGGEAVVSAGVEKSLKALAGVSDTKRVFGTTAIDTAIAANAEAAAVGSVSDTAVLATSINFADALSAAPYAYAQRAPIYLASTDGSMTAETAAALKNFKNVKIVGGTAVVPEATATALKAQGNSVERWCGDDCYQTSADIATKAVAAGVLSFDTVSVATGKSYYDALSASSAAGSKKSVLLLVDEGTAGSFGINATLAKNKTAIRTVNFLGGKAVVTPATQEAIKTALA